MNDRGLPTGEAFIEMETPQVTLTWHWSLKIMMKSSCKTFTTLQDIDKAMDHHKEMMGRRFVINKHIGGLEFKLGYMRSF